MLMIHTEVLVQVYWVEYQMTLVSSAPVTLYQTAVVELQSSSGAVHHDHLLGSQPVHNIIGHDDHTLL